MFEKLAKKMKFLGEKVISLNSIILKKSISIANNKTEITINDKKIDPKSEQGKRIIKSTEEGMKGLNNVMNDMNNLMNKLKKE